MSKKGEIQKEVTEGQKGSERVVREKRWKVVSQIMLGYLELPFGQNAISGHDYYRLINATLSVGIANTIKISMVNDTQGIC